MAGQGITGPILPLYARSFDVSTATVGLTITVFAFARLLVNLPAGTMADRHGRRLLLVGGPLVLSLGMIGSGLSVTIWDLLAWRFVAGAGSALYMTGAQLYILDVSSPDRRGRNLSYNSGALLAGLAIGPAIGGIVAELTNFRVPFLLVGGLAVGAAAYSYLRLDESLGARRVPAPSSGDEPAPAPTWSFLGSSTYLAICFMSLAMFATRSGTRATLVPLLGTDEFGLSEGELGALLGATASIGLILIGPAGFAADRIGRKRTIVPTGLAAAAGTFAIALSPSVAWLTASLFLLSFGTSVTGPAQYALVADIASEEQRGRALGVYRSAGDVGFLIAPPFLGWLSDATSIDTALVVNGCLVAGAALIVLVVAREPTRPFR